jgi:predicted acetyltransferase
VLVPEIYEGLWRRHPGCFARPRVWWDNRQLLDHPLQREGLSANRFAIYEEAGEAQGYAQYRVRERWNASGIPQGELRMVEMQGTPNARAALWRLLLDVDLVGRVSYWNDAVDSGLPWLLADPRRAERRMRDALWVRLMDVPRALEARSYAVEDRVVIGVQDETCPDNQANWQLDGAPGGAKCQRSSRAPDFELDVSDLGSVYLGAHSLFELSRAGRVRGDRDAIVRADRMLRTPSAPWCPEIF